MRIFLLILLIFGFAQFANAQPVIGSSARGYQPFTGGKVDFCVFRLNGNQATPCASNTACTVTPCTLCVNSCGLTITSTARLGTGQYRIRLAGLKPYTKAACSRLVLNITERYFQPVTSDATTNSYGGYGIADGNGAADLIFINASDTAPYVQCLIIR